MAKISENIFKHMGLSDKEFIFIQSHSSLVKYPSGDIIFRQSAPTSHLMVIMNGLIKIFKERRGKILIFELRTKGEMLGVFSLLSGKSLQYSAAAIYDTEILFIEKERVLNLLQSNKLYFNSFMKFAGNTGIKVYDRMMDYYQKQLPGRVADMLLYFSEKIFKATKFTFPVSRTELAELSGTTKESLIRTLTEFKNDRIIDIDNRKVSIRSIQILKKLREFG
jgi:CRP-like cAMP-binding protein